MNCLRCKGQMRPDYDGTWVCLCGNEDYTNTKPTVFEDHSIVEYHTGRQTAKRIGDDLEPTTW